MYQAENERTGERTELFFCEEELLDILDANMKPNDFWDVFHDGRLAYYYGSNKS